MPTWMASLSKANSLFSSFILMTGAASSWRMRPRMAESVRQIAKLSVQVSSGSISTSTLVLASTLGLMFWIIAAVVSGGTAATAAIHSEGGGGTRKRRGGGVLGRASSSL